jgi:lantibiotic modifying enzyme
MATLSTDPLTPSEPAPPAFGSIIARPRPEPQTTPLREQLLRAACGVGEHLSATALRGPRKASWANLTTGDGRSSVAGYARYDLHAGLPGILLFLDRLGEVTGTNEFDALFRSAFLMLRDLLHDGEVSLVNVGAFSGMGGILAAFGGIRTEWYDLPVGRLADRVIARLGERVPEHRTCSLFGGLAGGVAGLLSYHAATGSAAALDTAVRGGDRLLALMTRADGRPDWPSVHPSPPHATGFAVGTAGIAWTLLRLADAVGDGRFRAPALDALESAWLRYAASGRTPATSATWCHGAPGMVLSLLEARRDGVPALLTALEAAIGETLRGVDSQTTHALCNGALGALDVLLQAGDALGTTLRPRVEVRIRTVLDEAARGGWKCGVPLGIEPPGLMNGLAGIGYGLLRVADPDRVPSALTLGLPAGGTHRAEPFAPLM